MGRWNFWGFFLCFGAFYHFDFAAFEKVEFWQDIGIALLVDNAFYAGFGEHAFADAAGVFCSVTGGAEQANSFPCGQGQTPLLGAESVAYFSLGSGWYFTNIADAADFFAVCFFVPVISGFYQNFVVFHNSAGDVCSDAVSFRLHSID